MNKNELLSILHDWNFWRKEFDAGVSRRDYLAKVGDFLKTNQVLTVTGPRGTGKSYLMRQAARRLTEEGVENTNILMVNLEDPRPRHHGSV